MIRTALLTTLLLCFYSCSSDKKQTTSLEEMGLKGPVKSYKVTVFDISDKWAKPEQTRTGKGKDKDRYFFNPSGMIVRRESFITDRMWPVAEITQTLYDKTGKRIKDSLWMEHPFDYSGSYCYFYDESGNLSEKRFYDTLGKSRAQDRYSYDSKGVLLSSGAYYDNRCHFISFYRANANGDPVMETTFFSELKGKHMTYYRYNQQQKLVRRVGYGPDQSLIHKEVYSYNPQGDLIAVSHYNTDGTFHFSEQFTYRYDVRGNWVSQTRTSRGHTLDITERTIVYY